MTGHDFEWFWRNLPVPAGRAGAAAVCRLLLAEARGDATPDCIAGRLIEAATAGLLPAAEQAMAHLAEVASHRLPPTLLLTPSGGPDRLAAAGRMLEGIVAVLPTLPAALAAEVADVEAALRAGPPSHTLDVLREGLVPVPSLGEAELADRLRRGRGGRAGRGRPAAGRGRGVGGSGRGVRGSGAPIRPEGRSPGRGRRPERGGAFPVRAAGIPDRHGRVVRPQSAPRFPARPGGG